MSVIDPSDTVHGPGQCGHETNSPVVSRPTNEANMMGKSQETMTLAPTRRSLFGGALSLLGLIGFPNGMVEGRAETASSPSGEQPSVRASLPRASDVVMSVRSRRPHDLEALSAFRATRCEWTYTTDPDYVAALRSRVRHVGLAISPSHFLPGGPGGAIDIDGSDLTAPWFVKENAPWKSLSRPEGRQFILDLLSDSLTAGADSIQFDDPSTNYVLTIFAGGDFSREALEAFADYVSSDSRRLEIVREEFDAHGRDMGKWVEAKNGGSRQVVWPKFKKKYAAEPLFKLWVEFSKSVTVAFLQEVKRRAHGSGRAVPLSFNIPDPLPIPTKSFFLDIADYLVSEVTSPEHPCETFAQSACVRAWDMPFVPSLVPVSVATTRWFIALAYALGDHPLVPWDTYVPNKPRYYGTPDEYGDLFGFVLEHASFFDDFEVVTEVVVVVSEASNTKSTLYGLVKLFAAQGLNVDFCVLRTDGSTTVRKTKVAPKLAIVASGTMAEAHALFSQSRVMALSDFLSDPRAAMPLLRVTTTLGDRVVAVPKISAKDGSLAFHVVDTRGTAETIPDGAELVVKSSGSGRYIAATSETVTVVGPSRSEERRPVTRITNDHGVMLHIPIGGLCEWGIVFTAHG